jgi:hypothetical protein
LINAVLKFEQGQPPEHGARRVMPQRSLSLSLSLRRTKL